MLKSQKPCQYNNKFDYSSDLYVTDCGKMNGNNIPQNAICLVCLYNINFIYSADKIMDFKRAEPTCYRTIFPITPVPANKKSFFVHSTTRNAPYVHPRLDSIFELCRAFRIGP